MRKILFAGAFIAFLGIESTPAFAMHNLSEVIAAIRQARHIRDCTALAELCAVYRDEQSCIRWLNECDDIAIEDNSSKQSEE